MPEQPPTTAAAARASSSIADAGRTPRRRLARAAVSALLFVVVCLYLAVAGPMMWSALTHLSGAAAQWLLVALAATVSSMIAFAALRGHTLAVAGIRVSLRRTLAVSYGAGAVHLTLPAGGVFSTAYAYRHLRSWGASVSAATWSMTVTGLLASVTLGAVGLTGVALAGGAALWSIIEVLGAVVVIALLVWVTRHPDRLASVARGTLRGVNRLRRRPAETGFARLSEIVADLRVIQPSGRDWTGAVVLSAVNWLLDLGCLAACCAAIGIHVSVAALLITYTAGMAAASLLPVPAGLGAVETAMTVGLTVAGAVAAPALAAVLLYRLLSTGSVIVIGGLVVAAQGKQACQVKLRQSRTEPAA